MKCASILAPHVISTARFALEVSCAVFRSPPPLLDLRQAQAALTLGEGAEQAAEDAAAAAAARAAAAREAAVQRELVATWKERAVGVHMSLCGTARRMCGGCLNRWYHGRSER